MPPLRSFKRRRQETSCRRQASRGIVNGGFLGFGDIQGSNQQTFSDLISNLVVTSQIRFLLQNSGRNLSLQSLFCLSASTDQISFSVSEINRFFIVSYKCMYILRIFAFFLCFCEDLMWFCVDFSLYFIFGQIVQKCNWLGFSRDFFSKVQFLSRVFTKMSAIHPVFVKFQGFV